MLCKFNHTMLYLSRDVFCCKQHKVRFIHPLYVRFFMEMFLGDESMLREKLFCVHNSLHLQNHFSFSRQEMFPWYYMYNEVCSSFNSSVTVLLYLVKDKELPIKAYFKNSWQPCIINTGERKLWNQSRILLNLIPCTRVIAIAL